jgi:hypothetical protein
VTNVDPRQVREHPVHIRRPWETDLDVANRQKGAAQAPSEEPTYGPDGAVTAVGAVAAMKAMGGGAMRYTPSPAPAVEGGVTGE